MAAGSAQALIEGMQEMMDAVFKDDATPENKEIFLFSTDVTIADDTVNADLTEITTNGLAKQTLTKANFAAATEADPIVSVYNTGTGIEWTATGGPNTVYGWAVRGVTSLKLYFARNWGLKTVQDEETVTINPAEFKLDIPEA
ncbi:MAG: hypothetical protein AVO39_11090 [delta proteobacterium MLS_D]|nr:MAG: hypothetical protein AVO39_11090 [delta proteobacterium MLS_D]